ncbi:MAG: glutaredoxin domain-containing protein [Fervidicoccaceae archaeon]
MRREGLACNIEGLVLYTLLGDERCLPCARILRFLETLGLLSKVEVRDAREHKEELKWLTGGRTIVPVLLEPSSGKIMTGCPVDLSEFAIELERVFCSPRGRNI